MLPWLTGLTSPEDVNERTHKTYTAESKIGSQGSVTARVAPGVAHDLQ